MTKNHFSDRTTKGSVQNKYAIIGQFIPFCFVKEFLLTRLSKKNYKIPLDKKDVFLSVSVTSFKKNTEKKEKVFSDDMHVRLQNDP